MILTKVGKWLWTSCQMKDSINQTWCARNQVPSSCDEHTILNLMVSKAEFVVTNFFTLWCISQQSMWTRICKSVYYVDDLGSLFLPFVRLPLRELMNY